jgi:hypothetical protein
MREALDLDPEWGALDLIEGVEAAFGVGISDSEAIGCRTMGDLHDVIRARVPDWDSQAGPCGTPAVFHALRHVLDPERKERLTPATPLARAWRGSPRALLRRIRREARLTPPPLVLGWIGAAGLVALLCALAILLVGAVQDVPRILGAGILLAGLGSLMLKLDPGRLPERLATLGDLVRRLAALNAGWLRATGRRPPDSWTVLTLVAADLCTVPADEIGRDTLLAVPAPGDEVRCSRPWALP